MNNPLVSIITPVYNSERFIRQTIQSVLRQTYPHWELLIIDDGSVDNTAQIVQEYRQTEPRISYIYQQNQRQAAARNTGLKHAGGELVAFLDHDDLWLPEKLEKSVGAFLQEEQDLLFTGIYLFEKEEDLANMEALETVEIENQTYKGKDGLALFLMGNRVPMLTVVAKKEALLAIGGFKDYKIADDFRMWLLLLISGYTLRGISPALSLYRMHDEGTSAIDRAGSEDVLDIIAELSQAYPDAIDFHPAAKFWLSYFGRNAMTKQQIPQLKEQLQRWKISSVRINYALFLRFFIPYRSFQRKISRAIREA